MTEYHKFSQLKDKFPTFDSNNIDYTTAIGCRKALRCMMARGSQQHIVPLRGRG